MAGESERKRLDVTSAGSGTNQLARARILTPIQHRRKRPMTPPQEKLDFNPRILTGFDRWVYDTIRALQLKLKEIEEQLPNPRDYSSRDFPDSQ